MQTIPPRILYTSTVWHPEKEKSEIWPTDLSPLMLDIYLSSVKTNAHSSVGKQQKESVVVWA